MATSITPRTLKGFRDYLPADMAPRRAMIRTIERVFEAHGFGPLDTPALEYAEILTGKYGDEGEKLLYRFEDHGGRPVALRYDLTVPLARVVAQHGGQIAMPLRRYHIASVWRADKPQRGRFREFMQCDVDIVGSSSAVADAEILIAGLSVLKALGIEGARLHLNHRGLLRALLSWAQVAEGKPQLLALRAIDKWDKVGAEGVRAELGGVEGLGAETADRLMTAFSQAGADDDDVLDRLQALVGADEAFDRLRQVQSLVAAAGLGDMLRIDATIARGLDYYTGVIYETRLTDPSVAGIGAVMSGGRYDELVGMFGKQQVPATGISVGLDRLLAALRELALVETGADGALIHVTVFGPEQAGASLRAATALRAAGLPVEVGTDGGKLGKQLARADKRGCRFAVVIGPDEAAAGRATCKDLRGTRQETVDVDALATLIRDFLRAP